MRIEIYARTGRLALLMLALLEIVVPKAMAQANNQGQWSTLQTLMPINPVHVALLGNGKVLLWRARKLPAMQSGCPSGQPYGPSNNSGALLWDPVTRAITQFSVSWDMFCNAMALLKDGRATDRWRHDPVRSFCGQPW